MTEQEPSLRVLFGDATPDEIAALLAVVAARAAAAERRPPEQLSLWARRSSLHRRTAVAGPEGPWRTSLWPH